MPFVSRSDDISGRRLPGYGSIPFILNEDFNIAQGLIRMVGVGKTVRRNNRDRVEA